MDEALVQTVALLIGWMTALIFAAAVRHKILARERFKASFLAYDLVPAGLVGPAVTLLIVAEVGVVLGCLAMLPAALYAAAALLLLYAAAIGINLLRGRRSIDCGCGDEPTPLGPGLLVRNGVVCVLSVAAATGLSGTDSIVQGTAGSMLVAALGAAIAYGIYASVEQLLANRGRHRRLWLGVS